MRPRLETLRDFMAPGSGVPPVLAHRAHKSGHAVVRHPHVLARRALKLCSFRAQEVGVLAGRAQSEGTWPPARRMVNRAMVLGERAQSEAAPPPAPEQAKQN